MEKNIVECSGMAFDVMQYTVLNGLEVIDPYCRNGMQRIQWIVAK